MKNRYPKACSVCQGLVPAGEGTLYKDFGPYGDAGWGVVHTGSCPRGMYDNVRKGYAQAFTRRVFAMLRCENLSIDQIREAARGLAVLVDTGWTTREVCARILVGSKAMEQMDRVEAEILLGELLPEESNA